MHKCFLMYIVGLIIFSGNISYVFANQLDDNVNYIKVAENSATILYLNKGSVQVECYEPPIYEISSRLVIYDKYGQRIMDGDSRDLFRYNYDTKQIWVYNFSQDKWIEQDINGISKGYKKLFAEVFKVAYSIDFYGSKKILRDDQIAIGGISPYGGTAEYVRSIYGEPDGLIESIDREGWYWQKWIYGDSFEIFFIGEKKKNEKFKVFMLKSTAKNGLTTPDGIKVGSSISEVREKYGYNGGSYWYKGRDGCDLVFTVKDGVVTMIGAGWSF